MHMRALTIASLAALLLLGVAGCVYPSQTYGGGPPPYVHPDRHHDGVDLTWYADLGVYAVVGLPSIYFWDGRYYRYHGDAWQYSGRPRGHWRPHHGHVPSRLANRYHRKATKRHKPERHRGHH